MVLSMADCSALCIDMSWYGILHIHNLLWYTMYTMIHSILLFDLSSVFHDLRHELPILDIRSDLLWQRVLFVIALLAFNQVEIDA